MDRTKKSPLTQHLVSMGAKINYPQMASNINDSIDLVVYTAAIAQDNPEFCAALEKNSSDDARRLAWPNYEKL